MLCRMAELDMATVTFIMCMCIIYMSYGAEIRHDAISIDEFREMKKMIVNLQEKSQVQERKIADLENEIQTLKNKEKGENRLMEMSTNPGKTDILNIKLDVLLELSSFHKFSGQKNKNKQQTHHDNEPNGKEARIVPLPSESVIAFYAYMSSNENSPSTHHTIIYDHEVTNIGNGYSKHSGIFTAPVDGVYVFSWTIFMSSPGEYMSIEITLNSQPVGASFVHGIQDYSTVSGNAVLAMQKNDVVFTRTHSTYVPHGTIRSDSIMRSAFSGWCVSCH